MVDAALSTGMIAFVGSPGLTTHQLGVARVVEALGDSGRGSYLEIRTILHELEAVEPAPSQADSIAEMGRAVETWLRTRHADLSVEAVQAVANRYTFQWK